MRVEEAIGGQIARLRAQRELSLAELGEALGQYLGRPWSRQAVHQAERGQRSFTAAELTALALALDTSVQALFRAEDDQMELPGRAISREEYRGTLLNRETDSPLDGLEELIIALHDIGEILERPALARMARIARAAEQVTGLSPAQAAPREGQAATGCRRGGSRGRMLPGDYAPSVSELALWGGRSSGEGVRTSPRERNGEGSDG